jgi:hypothetical protein
VETFLVEQKPELIIFKKLKKQKPLFNWFHFFSFIAYGLDAIMFNPQFRYMDFTVKKSSSHGRAGIGIEMTPENLFSKSRGRFF